MSYGLASSAASGTITDRERELGQLTRLVVMRVGIAVPDWVSRCVGRGIANAITRAGTYWSIGAEECQALYKSSEIVGWTAAEDVEGELGALLAAVEDLRPAGPRLLAVLQKAISYPADVLRQAGAPKARRDRSAVKLFPGDVYNIAPRSLAELHPMVPELLASWEDARFAVIRERHGA